jgi:predicted ribosome quality control (RQC) complex YloA/Tae2 family protein
VNCEGSSLANWLLSVETSRLIRCNSQVENFFLSSIVSEIAPIVLGREVVAIRLELLSLIVDLRLPGQVLLVSLDPSEPTLFLKERNKERDTAIVPRFILHLRKELIGARVVSFFKPQLDRFVQVDFERGEKSRCSIVFALTGRSTNAYLLGTDTKVVAMLDDRGPFKVGDRLQLNPTKGLDVKRMLDTAAKVANQQEIIEHFFSGASPFGPILKNEFIARCREADPVSALRSLLDDLFDRRPVPVIYSRLPMDQLGKRILSKGDLLLSHIELHQASGFNRVEFPSLSQAAQAYYNARQRTLALQKEADALHRLLASEIEKRERILAAIKSDLARFEDPEGFKRCGDLLLANITTAKVEGHIAKVKDYYDPEQREIEIDIGDSRDLQTAASNYYRLYNKARRTIQRAMPRAQEVTAEADALRSLLGLLESAPTADTISYVSNQVGKFVKAVVNEATRKHSDERRAKIGRQFISSDGYEILVGRSDAENDLITFRLARSQDLWLHAADYPGSHVLVRNPQRKAIPHRTILEAAELAAFYSQARKEAKAAVNYTQKKFVSKPPRAKQGLVRLSSFKTVLVEPRCNLRRPV